MTIGAETIILFGGVLAVVTTIITLGWKFFKWISGRDKITSELIRLNARIDKLEQKHDKDQGGTQDELTLVVYGLLACLKGLVEQGCDGPVKEAVDKLEKHINQKAHNQF